MKQIEHKLLRIPTGGPNQLAIYTTWSRSWTRDYREQTQIVVGWRIWTKDLQIQIQRPKPPGHVASHEGRLSNEINGYDWARFAIYLMSWIEI